MLTCVSDQAYPIENLVMEQGSFMNDELSQAEIDALMDKGYVLAVQLLKSPEDASDVLQDSLCKLVHGRGFDRRKGALQAWFLKVVRNRALDLIKGRKGHEPDQVEVLHDERPGPDQRAEVRELDQIVRRLLDAMPVEQREIILLRDYHDLSYAEIAEVMGVRAGTVMSRLHRARTELREQMRQYL